MGASASASPPSLALSGEASSFDGSASLAASAIAASSAPASGASASVPASAGPLFFGGDRGVDDGAGSTSAAGSPGSASAALGGRLRGGLSGNEIEIDRDHDIAVQVGDFHGLRAEEQREPIENPRWHERRVEQRRDDHRHDERAGGSGADVRRRAFRRCVLFATGPSPSIHGSYGSSASPRGIGPST